jgi:uncharacterized membrane protein YeaQ/YmgE (transglycosylase-associated protein family)
MEIGLLGFIVLIALAALVGFIAKAIVGFHRGGLLAAIGLGLIGGLLGVWLAQVADLPMWLAVNIDGLVFPILWALLGTVLLVAIVAFAMRARVDGGSRRVFR